MTPQLAEYIEAGKALEAEERLEAAHQLLLSVDQDADVDRRGVDAAWDRVVARRAHEIANGTAQIVDGPVGIAQIRSELSGRRACG